MRVCVFIDFKVSNFGFNLTVMTQETAPVTMCGFYRDVMSHVIEI